MTEILQNILKKLITDVPTAINKVGEFLNSLAIDIIQGIIEHVFAVVFILVLYKFIQKKVKKLFFQELERNSENNQGAGIIQKMKEKHQHLVIKNNDIVLLHSKVDIFFFSITSFEKLIIYVNKSGENITDENMINSSYMIDIKEISLIDAILLFKSFVLSRKLEFYDKEQKFFEVIRNIFSLKKQPVKLSEDLKEYIIDKISQDYRLQLLLKVV